MFSLVSGIYDAYLAPTQLNLLVVGGSGVGKTALLERLKVTQFTKNKKPEPSSTSKNQNPYLRRDFPPSLLPPSRRNYNAAVAVSSRPSTAKSQPKQHSTAAKQPKKDEAPPKRRSFLACPAPSRYSKTQEDSDDDEEDNTQSSDKVGEPAPKLPQPDSTSFETHEISESTRSMEDVPLSSHLQANDENNNNQNNHTDDITADAKSSQTIDPAALAMTEDDDDEDQQVNVKSKAKMLPLHKIRPTIGMNLGKVDICGAVCHVWDLGGKMQDLWERYYQDCDAVIFVWRIAGEEQEDGQQQKPQDTTNGEEGSDDDDDRPPLLSFAQQLTMLEQVRKAIPDDVPFLIWGHHFPDDRHVTAAQPQPHRRDFHYGEAYSTASLFPHYHNPLMNLYFGSSRSGAGVRQAMEWLIPIAARQKKIKEKATAAAADKDDGGDDNDIQQ